MPQKIYVNLDFQNSVKPVNVPDPVDQQDLATKAFVEARFGAQSFKEHVRVASTGNVNISSAPSAIDSVTLATNDRVLLKDQTSQPENGIYVFNGAGSAMTRAVDANTAAELENALTSVDEGTVNALTSWRQITLNFTLGSGNVVWQSENNVTPAASETVAGKAELATQAETDAGTDDARIVTPAKLNAWPGKARRAAGAIGDGAATQYDVSHNFGTRDVVVSVYRNASPWDVIICDVEYLDTNTVRLRFAAAPSSNQFRVVVVG